MKKMLAFKDICCLLNEVQSAKGLSNKSAIVHKHFSKFRELTQFNVQQNFELFYQGIRLIVPRMDHERKSYNMKENKIAKTIIKMLNLPEGSDKQNLQSFYRIGKNMIFPLDFADVVHNTLRKYIPSNSLTITVTQLNSYLDSIANRSSDKELDETMLKMFRNVEERKWIIRIMLKELKLGIDNNKILTIFHPDAVKYYSSNNNLKKVFEVLWSPSIKLHEFNINLFEPFQPMLSKRCDANSFTKDFPQKKLFFIETKFDGERFQLHMDKGKFKYFSRNGYDFTDNFGASFSSGTFTPKLKDVFHDNVEKIILDGEMMLWNSRKKIFGSKGMTFDVKKLNSTGYIQPCFCVYDILLLNDEVLTNKELLERVKLLRKAIQKNIEGVIQISCYEESVNPNEIINALNKVADTEGEGIVVKDPKSFYKFKDRNSGWFKIKIEYFDDAVVDLDLILMGGNYKSYSNELNSFIVGVYSNNDGETILSCGRVASGLNFEQLDLINKKISDKGKKFSEIVSKKKVKLAFGKDVPDICIEPEDSLIFTVRATELVSHKNTNSAFKTPYTLRFARVKKIRDDKSHTECLSITELLELCQQNKEVIKLNKRYLTLEDTTTIKRSKTKKKLDVDIETLTKLSKCLSGIKFFVLSELENYSMDKVEVLIEKYGGTFSLNLDEDVNIVLVGSITPKVKELLKQDNNFDMVKIEWLLRITVSEQVLHYKQDEVLSIGLSYYNCLADEVDKYGDSYTEEVHQEALKKRLQIMSEMDCYSNINDSIIFNPNLPLFNKYISYFDEYEVINDFTSKQIYNLFIDKIEFTYRKGIVMDVLTPDVNLIIMHSRNNNRRNVLEKYARDIHCKNFRVIERSKLYAEETL